MKDAEAEPPCGNIKPGLSAWIRLDRDPKQDLIALACV
jgi:hypothetical protein